MKKIISLIVIIFALFTSPVFAETCNPAFGPCQPEEKTSTSSTVKLKNPLGENNSDPRIIVGNIIKLTLGLVGSMALIIFIYGGLMWMTSAGNSDRVTKGRDTLVWASLGLIVVFSSYTLVAYVLQSFVS